ncbi:transcription termination factor MTERF8, chloroplastic [Tripterygium wilfordii]|uniref:transcription termination factor MTERF8, chloroplastic n=1 Tax=Tripterygium wilfordii TaxID=458696 RepID=UPI0018F828EE|nr:transcription termination factor MTERF8, chloroplastic [Tripterygium wilfordii]
MEAIAHMFASPSSSHRSSYCCINNLTPAKLQSSVSPTAIPHFHYSFARFQLTPLSNQVRCGCLHSPATLQTEAGMLFSLFREIGFHERETELFLDAIPALKFAPFDSIRARVVSLESVGIKGVALYRLISKSPIVLAAEEIDSLLRFVREDLEGKLEPRRLERLLTATEPQFLVGFDQKVRLLLHRGVPKEKLPHVLNKVNLTKSLCLKSLQEIDRTIGFLDRFGGVDIILRRPVVLNYNLDTQLIPRIGFLTRLSEGDDGAAGIVLRKLPAILSYSLEHMESHAELLRSFGGLSNEQIFKILLVFPNLISASKERKLRPRIEFLKQCGLNPEEIYRFLTKAPLFLGLSFEDNIVHKLVFLVKIGFRYRTKELVVAMGAVTRTSCENFQKLIGLFLSYGLSVADIVSMSKKHPQILQYNHTSLEEKMTFLVEGMGRDIEELLSFPAFLGYNLTHRIKHRYEVKRQTIGEGMSLNKLLSVSSHRFSTGTEWKNAIQDCNADAE